MCGWSAAREWHTSWLPMVTQVARRWKRSGIRVIAVREVLVRRLNQTEPGQLAEVSRKMAEAGVNIEVQYSDHDHQLILVVDDMEKGRAVSEAWKRRT